uniref:Putative competence protein CoiA-like family protein n=1 Tax=viral metagenome TaxID=1070528 RepID=A0A6M3Y5B3_9ZZZZ
MLYALNDKLKVKAEPNLSASCPWCDADMISKCGDVKIWHWAHKSNPCDTKPETEWHLQWKTCFPDECVEIKITHKDKYKIADVQSPSGMVVEFQNSPISKEEIRDREHFYGVMSWVFNTSSAFEENRIVLDGERLLEWKNPKRSWLSTQRTVYLDLGVGVLFKVDGIEKGVDDYDHLMLYIKGKQIMKEDFIELMLSKKIECENNQCLFRCIFKNDIKECPWHWPEGFYRLKMGKWTKQ